MIANTKTVAFLLFTLCSIISVNGQALSTKTPSPSTSPDPNAPTMTPTGSRAPTIFDHFGKGGKGNGAKLSKKTRSPVYKASKLTASGKGMSGKGGKAGKGSTYAPVAGKGMSGKGGKAGKGSTYAPVLP